MLTQEEVRALFDYDVDAGRLIWKDGEYTNRRWSRDVPGNYAESYTSRYPRVSIDNVRYLAHRIIFLWHHGRMPVVVDHINGVLHDNRIENLRECNQMQNIGNADYGSMRGIEKHGRKWRVRICGSNWKMELGSYETIEEAIEARNAGHREYFGEFAFHERSLNE